MPKFTLNITKTEVLHGIYNGGNSPTNLNRNLYEAIAEVLLDAMVKGYKEGKRKQGKLNAKIVRNDWSKPLEKIMMDTKDEAMVNELTTNIYMFSASKVFSETTEMSKLLLDENGLVRSFKDFEIASEGVWDTYNNVWLNTEFDTAVASARSASKWVEIQKNKSERPYLRYSAVMDDHTCEICASLDDITLPADDSFFDENTPPNHFNCFAKGTKVLTVNGWRDIDTINVDDLVISGNGKPRKALTVHKNHYEGELIKISTGEKSISPTPTHPILISGQWVSAEDVKVNDSVSGFTGGNNKVTNIESEFYSGFVYNLEVEIDKSYITEIGVVHNCECVVEQLEESDLEEVDGLSDQEEVDDAVEKSHEHKDEMWNFNPGKQGEIFPTSGTEAHPFFSVDKASKEWALQNFGLPLPELFEGATLAAQTNDEDNED